MTLEPSVHILRALQRSMVSTLTIRAHVFFVISQCTLHHILVTCACIIVVMVAPVPFGGSYVIRIPDRVNMHEQVKKLKTVTRPTASKF